MEKIQKLKQQVSDNYKKIQEIISSEMPLRERTKKRRVLEKRNKEISLKIEEIEELSRGIIELEEEFLKFKVSVRKENDFQIKNGIPPYSLVEEDKMMETFLFVKMSEIQIRLKKV